MSAPSLLIVDDDQTELALMSRIAMDAFPNAQIRTVSNARAAQDACSQDQYDCVVLDYNMPGEDGLVCASRLREAHPYLPIILSTSFGDEMLAARAVAGAVTDYIPKSRISTVALHRVVKNAIHTSHQARIIDEQRSELENFAYALAHDFKQPIRQIRTFAGMVSDSLRDGNTETTAQHLAFLNDAARRLGDLVDVMSQYTLLSHAPKMDNVALNEVFSAVESSLQPYLAEREGALVYETAPIVWGNEALVVQVMQNLVVNGLKYNQSPVPTVTITTECSEDWCTITVRDNGIGIEPKYFQEIFKPLGRLHRDAEYPGSGLGLTLAQKALTAMGGTISCESELGAGTAFIVKIKSPPGSE